MHTQRLRTVRVRGVQALCARRSQRVDRRESLPLLALARVTVRIGTRSPQFIQPTLRFEDPIVGFNRPTTGHLWIDGANCRATYRCEIAGKDRARVVEQGPTAITVLQAHPCGPTLQAFPLD